MKCTAFRWFVSPMIRRQPALVKALLSHRLGQSTAVSFLGRVVREYNLLSNLFLALGVSSIVSGVSVVGPIVFAATELAGLLFCAVFVIASYRGAVVESINAWLAEYESSIIRRQRAEAREIAGRNASFLRFLLQSAGTVSEGDFKRGLIKAWREGAATDQLWWNILLSGGASALVLLSLGLSLHLSAPQTGCDSPPEVGRSHATAVQEGNQHSSPLSSIEGAAVQADHPSAVTNTDSTSLPCHASYLDSLPPSLQSPKAGVPSPSQSHGSAQKKTEGTPGESSHRNFPRFSKILPPNVELFAISS